VQLRGYAMALSEIADASHEEIFPDEARKEQEAKEKEDVGDGSEDQSREY
jgi:hypothetical protein